MEKKAEKRTGGNPRGGIYFLAAAAVCLAVVIITGTIPGRDTYSQRDIRKFEKVLHRKEQLLETEFKLLVCRKQLIMI